MKTPVIAEIIIILGLSAYWAYESIVSESRVAFSVIFIVWAFFYPLIFDLLGTIKHLDAPVATRRILTGLATGKSETREDFYRVAFYIANAILSLLFLGCLYLFL